LQANKVGGTALLDDDNENDVDENAQPLRDKLYNNQA